MSTSRYIPQQEIKPGCVYATDTGVEYLYLGQLTVTQAFCAQQNRTDGPVHGNLMKIGPKHFYVRMSNTRGLRKLTVNVNRIMKQCDTLDEFIDKHIEIAREGWLTSMDETKWPKRFATMVSDKFNGQAITNGVRTNSKKYESETAWRYDIFTITTT